MTRVGCDSADPAGPWSSNPGWAESVFQTRVSRVLALLQRSEPGGLLRPDHAPGDGQVDLEVSDRIGVRQEPDESIAGTAPRDPSSTPDRSLGRDV